ncbi:hypothetical protein Q5752_000668 [Cryptotrichosporon argae]
MSFSYGDFQPTNLTYDGAEFDPFTTCEYMEPERDSWHLTQLEEFAVDNLIDRDIDLLERMLQPMHNTYDQYQWMSDFFPKLVYEWHFWHDRDVVSAETNARMMANLADLLYKYHHTIINPDTGERFDIEWAMAPARAIRERMHPEYGHQPWEDEYP